MILVDSSVWVDYFNGTATRESNHLDDLLGVEPIAIGDLILTEVLQGFRNDGDFRTAKNLMSSLTIYSMLGRNGRFARPKTIVRYETAALRSERPATWS